MKLTTFRPILTYSAFAISLTLPPNLPWIPTLQLAERSDIRFDFRNMRFGLPGITFSIPPNTMHLPDQGMRLELRKTVDPHALIRAAARKHRVPAAFVKSIVAAESNFNCDAVSPKGAIGLMQLMPATAQEYGADPNVPEQNVDAGTQYLRVLMDRYSRHPNSLKRVIAAYNAGPGKVDHYRGVPPFRETRAYVARVLRLLRHYEKEIG
jgi:hypothetical protein